MKISLIVLILSLCFVFDCAAQQVDKTKQENAVVYVYSLAAPATFGRLKPAVFVGADKVAQIRPNHFFVLSLEPGKYAIHFKSKKSGGVEMDFKPNSSYYLRVKWRNGGAISPEGIDVVQKEGAVYDLKQVKPIDPDNIIDKKRVSTEIKNNE